MDTYTVQQLADELGMSERELFAWLRDAGLIDRHHGSNAPTRKSRERRWLVGQTTDYTRGQTGARSQYIRPLLTPRGREAVRQMLTWRGRRNPLAEHLGAVAETLADASPADRDHLGDMQIALGRLAAAQRLTDPDRRRQAATDAGTQLIEALLALAARKQWPVAQRLLDIADATQQEREHAV